MAREMLGTRCTNPVHKGRFIVVKPYLPKGSRTYKIHPRVPAEYRGVVGATHVTRSLGTGDLREAKRRVSSTMQVLYGEWDALLIKANPAGDSRAAGRITSRSGLYFDDVDHARAFIYETARWGEQIKRAEIAERIRLNPDAFWGGKIMPLPSEGMDGKDIWTAASLAFKSLAVERHQRMSNELAMGQLDSFRGLVKAIFNLPHGQDDAFVFAMAGSLLSFWERIGRDDTGIYWFADEADGSFFVQPLLSGLPTATDALQRVCRPSEKTSPAPNLLAICDAYIRERDQSLTNERVDTLKAVVRDLIEVIGGDKTVAAYGREDANNFKAVLLTLPGNWNKRQGLREHGLVEASRLAVQLGLPRQAAATIRKKWSLLASLFDYAQLNYEGVKNPFNSKSLVVSDGTADNEQGDPFTADELKVLLNSLHRRMPCHLYWISLVSLYSGARLNEISQLSKALILHHDDQSYIYFSPKLRLKDKACVRSVPIHPRLLELGFLDYVESCSDALFPGLPRHKSGRLSDAPSKAFSRHLKRIGIKRPRLSFHSLRHTFLAAMKRGAPRDSESRERLAGHTIAGVAGRYGDSYEAEAHDMTVLIERAKLIGSLRFAER